MFINNTEAKEILEKKGIDFENKELVNVNMGGANFCDDGRILTTIGLGPCVGLLAFSDEFSYLSHIDMGNMLGQNFDDRGNSIRIAELKRKLESLHRLGNLPKTIYLTTISSQTFVYDKKWWSERALSLDSQISDFIELCESYGIDTHRLPHHQSTFVAIDSKSGEFFYEHYGYPVKTQIQDEEKKEYLYSKEDSFGNLEILPRTFKDKAGRLEATIECDLSLGEHLKEMMKSITGKGKNER